MLLYAPPGGHGSALAGRLPRTITVLMPIIALTAIFAHTDAAQEDGTC